jgi:hypothetical protein
MGVKKAEPMGDSKFILLRTLISSQHQISHAFNMWLMREVTVAPRDPDLRLRPSQPLLTIHSSIASPP